MLVLSSCGITETNCLNSGHFWDVSSHAKQKKTKTTGMG